MAWNCQVNTASTFWNCPIASLPTKPTCPTCSIVSGVSGHSVSQFLDVEHLEAIMTLVKRPVLFAARLLIGLDRGYSATRPRTLITKHTLNRIGYCRRSSCRGVKGLGQSNVTTSSLVRLVNMGLRAFLNI